MYCDRCGTSVSSGAQFCGSCGKPLGATPAVAGAPAGVADAAGVRPIPDGRVQRHIQLLATLWLANGVLRLVGISWMLVFGRMFLPFLSRLAGPGNWPFSRGWPFDFLALGIYSTAIFLGVFGILHLLLAWGLFQREPWARMLGLVIGFLALLRFPFGTALGIYTIWVLLPEHSGQEYARLSGASA